MSGVVRQSAGFSLADKILSCLHRNRLCQNLDALVVSTVLRNTLPFDQILSSQQSDGSQDVQAAIEFQGSSVLAALLNASESSLSLQGRSPFYHPHGPGSVLPVHAPSIKTRKVVPLHRFGKRISGRQAVHPRSQQQLDNALTPVLACLSEGAFSPCVYIHSAIALERQQKANYVHVTVPACPLEGMLVIRVNVYPPVSLQR